MLYLTRLLDDLLDVSRITRGKLDLRMEHVYLNSVVGAAVEAVRPLIERRRHALSVDLPGEVVALEGDPVRLAQVFTNLLGNAAKYTDDGGKIYIGASIRDKTVRVCVRDNGIGISSAVLPHIFDMFSQAAPALERSEGGLGIGLALSKGLLTLHGGTIIARSEGAGRGTEFVVELPVIKQSGPPRPWDLIRRAPLPQRPRAYAY